MESIKIKRAEFYSNKFPLEDLLPELNEIIVQAIVLNCEYTIDNDTIAKHDFPDNPELVVNIEDAKNFYKMGYEAAKNRVGSVLEPYTRIV